ncbi:MAG: sulfatase-like hydrolase/transferase [Prevotellaceae bacterium]|jgi:glucan phosphoethanolaminetransferase (alkaline phosphatase superfamily)|nr:sulfatase-like hydrolase/transferase [Prevotellaceae bacterium]
MQILGLIFLFIFSAIIISLFKNRAVRIILAILFGIFFVMQIMSLYLGGSFIDYRFYLHFNLNSLEMAGGYHKQIFWTILTLIVTPITMYFFAFFTQRAQSVIAQRTQRNKNSALSAKIFAFFARTFKFGILIISLIIIILPQESIYHKLKEIVDVAGYSTHKNSDFEQILKNLEEKSEVPNQKFTLKEDLNAEFGGKNIIILSLESFEKAFIHDANADLAPNLRRLKNEWNFYEMQPQDRSHWTAGSLYTVFTGLPCIFAGHSNDFFAGANQSKIISLGDVLNACNYDTYHLSNNAEFSGTKDILKTFGIKHILDKNFGNKNLRQMAMGGAYDKDIFAKAKEIILRENADNKPFMLWLSTTQLHNPDGVVDDEVTKITGQKSTQLETVAFATDYLINDFLLFLQQNDFFEKYGSLYFS